MLLLKSYLHHCPSYLIAQHLAYWLLHALNESGNCTAHTCSGCKPIRWTWGPNVRRLTLLSWPRDGASYLSFTICHCQCAFPYCDATVLKKYFMERYTFSLGASISWCLWNVPFKIVQMKLMTTHRKRMTPSEVESWWFSTVILNVNQCTALKPVVIFMTSEWVRLCACVWMMVTSVLVQHIACNHKSIANITSGDSFSVIFGGWFDQY